MNQILKTEQKSKKIFRLFKIQFIISFVSLIILFIYISKESKLKNIEEKVTDIVSINAKITNLFESENICENSIYFCKLKIEKIDLEYYVYKMYSEELLKILPCKFYGESLEDEGNICIIGHNYFNNSFFGRLDELKIGDKIVIEDMLGKVYCYYVYNICEIDEKDINEAIKSAEVKTVTLCTCTISKNRRLIIRAKT